MRTGYTVVAVAALASVLFGAQEDVRPAVRFEAVDIYIASGDKPLAAYQFEFSDPERRVTIVGIEGGEHAAFKKPPYYDPKALRNNRVIVAAFSTASDLPAGRTRVATIMVQISGPNDADYDLKLTVAATADGSTIPATISLSKGA